MDEFEKFKKIHGEPENCEKVTSEQVSAFDGKLPEILLEDWAKNGWCSYGEGLLWTINPDDYEDILSDWLTNTEDSYAFIRTSFGSIFFRNGEKNYFLDVLNKEVSKVFSRIDYVFDGTLCDNDYLDSVILRPLHRKTLKKFGLLSKDECYGIFPGPESDEEDFNLENVKKVKVREYLTILTQL